MVSCQKKQVSDLLTNLVNQLEAFFGGETTWTHVLIRVSEKTDFGCQVSIPWLAFLDMIQTMIIRLYIHT